MGKVATSIKQDARLTLNGEIWKPIPNYPNYFASNLGRIKRGAYSYTQQNPIRNCLCRHVMPEKIMAQHLVKTITRPNRRGIGYLFCAPRINGVNKRLAVHVAVATAFLGERPQGYDVCHIDNNPMNNRIENLKYGTRKENMANSIRDLSLAHTPLTAEQIIEIYTTRRQLYGITRVLFNDIIAGRKFSSVTGAERKHLVPIPESVIADIKSLPRKVACAKYGLSLHQIKAIRAGKCAALRPNNNIAWL